MTSEKMALEEAVRAIEARYGSHRPNPRVLSPEAELGYIAGIIDGEGSILWDSDRRMLTVTVTNTSHPLIFHFMRYGGNVSENRRVAEHHKRCWRWSVSGNRAADLLREIQPYLLIKRKRAGTVLMFWDASGPRRSIERRSDLD